MKHDEIVAEGNRLAETLITIARMIADPETIPEQRAVVKANGEIKKARLDKLTDAMDADCNCNHTKTAHVNGQGLCRVGSCKCDGWEIEI
jgi:hypothetical protein